MKRVVTSAGRERKAPGGAPAGGREPGNAVPSAIVGIGASAGLVITFVDITAAKTLEAQLRAAVKTGTEDGARP